MAPTSTSTLHSAPVTLPAVAVPAVGFFNATLIPPSNMISYAVCRSLKVWYSPERPRSLDLKSEHSCCSSVQGAWNETLGCRLVNEQGKPFEDCLRGLDNAATSTSAVTSATSGANATESKREIVVERRWFTWKRQEGSGTPSDTPSSTSDTSSGPTSGPTSSASGTSSDAPSSTSSDPPDSTDVPGGGGENPGDGGNGGFGEYSVLSALTDRHFLVFLQVDVWSNLRAYQQPTHLEQLRSHRRSHVLLDLLRFSLLVLFLVTPNQRGRMDRRRRQRRDKHEQLLRDDYYDDDNHRLRDDGHGSDADYGPRAGQLAGGNARRSLRRQAGRVPPRDLQELLGGAA